MGRLNKFAMLRTAIIFAVLAIPLLLSLASCAEHAQETTQSANRRDSLPPPYRFFVEFTDGRSVAGTVVYHDTNTDLNSLTLNDSTPPIQFPHVRVKRILSVSDPIHPPTEISWSDRTLPTSPPPEPSQGTAVNPINNSIDCDCMGHLRTNGWQFFDAKLGAAIKGTSSYTQVSPVGTVQSNSVFFGPRNSGGTQLDIHADVAGGYRINKWDLGLSLEIIPTDSFIYFPLSAHARYYFEQTCCSWNVFANAGIPFDFQTGEPVILTPLFSDRQRRYFSFGIGKIWPMNESMEWAADLGYRYMVIPLAEIQCCPDITLDNRFPARESQSFFLQLGVSF
jgi:hypothetical protein